LLRDTALPGSGRLKKTSTSSFRSRKDTRHKVCHLFRQAKTLRLAYSMSRPFKKPGAKSLLAAYACVCVSLVLVMLLGVWGAYRDLVLIRSTLLNAEISRLRSQATRRAGHLEAVLQYEVPSTDSIAWETLRDSGWLSSYWQIVSENRQEGQLYAAIVDRSGLVVLHSDQTAQNQHIGQRWYDRVVSEVGDDVVQTHGETLAAGQPAFDVRIPIQIGDREVASYHEGLSVAWVEQQSEALRGSVLRRWTLVIGGITVLVIMSFISLLYIVRRKSQVQRAADAAELRRVSEIGQLAAGLAHEIRNPLHAIRLNLHTFRRAESGHAELGKDEITEMIDQSAKEVDRLEHLMSELLGFASPKEARDEVVDLKAELETTLDFIQHELLHKDLEVRTAFPEQPVQVRMDSGRLRQVILNLLMNAQDAIGEGGGICISLRRLAAKAEVAISDSGEGISPSDHERIFEPFFTTKDTGTGLGLPLVKRFVEEADGAIACESNGAAGATFRITLPISGNTK
jgi:signal transduction histidine kinase